MLVLTRKVGESILVGDNIRILICDVRKHPNGQPQVRIGIEAPRELRVIRDELEPATGGTDRHPEDGMD